MIPSRESWDVIMLLIKLFLNWNTSALGGTFPGQKRKIPGNPEIPDVFPARKSLIGDISDSQLRKGLLINIFELWMGQEYKIYY